MSDENLRFIAPLTARRNGMGRKMDPFYDSFGELKPYNPSLREKAEEFIRSNWPGPNPETKTRDLMTILDWSPAGVLMDVNDAGRSVGSGNYLDAGITAGLALLPGPNGTMKSIANNIAGRALEKRKALASKSARIYDPEPLPQRDFEADYPNGATGDATGRLLFDVEGRPLDPGAVVAGRTHIGGGDSGVPAEAYDSIATQATGRNPQAVSKSTIGGDAGQYVVVQDRRSGKVTDRSILLDRALAPEQAKRVLSHELSHAIDERVGIIPSAGLDDELRDVYNHLNNPQKHGPRFGPEQHGYSGERVKHELMAEAVRAYMHDPNYLKSVAPRTAAAIRAAVNPHPGISKIIQFNSLAPLGLGVGATAMTAQGQDGE